jgi:voltage-gated potassium channel
MPKSPSFQELPAPHPKHQLVIHASYELFVLALVVLQIINSALWLVLRDQIEGQVILLIASGVSVFFIADSVYRWLRAPSRSQFLFARHGWLLWLGSLPAPFLAVLRLLWYRIAIGALRRSEVAAMVDIVVEKRAQSTLLGVIFAAIVVLEAAAALILGVESQSLQANIHTAGDAVWWTVVTVATVGYGDKYPVTSAGRVIGGFVMVVGVSLFGVLTSFLAQWFVRARRANEAATAAVPFTSADVQALSARLEALTALLEQQGAAQQADAAELRATLADIQARLARE